MATTVFRVEKKENYTIISNNHLQDKNLSNKAKGLLTIMLSLPPSWDMTLKGLVSLSSDGIDSIRATIAELERNGYLSRSRSRDELGRLQCTEYQIHEQPIKRELDNNVSNTTDAEHLQSKESDSISVVEPEGSDKAIKTADRSAHIGKSNVVQNGKSNMDQIGKPDVVQMGFPYLGKTYIGKSNAIKDLSNKDTYVSNDYSLSNQSNLNDIDKIDRISLSENLLQKRKQYEEIIKQNIEYDIITDTDDEDYKSFVELAVEIMVDAVTSTNPMIQIKGQEIPTEAVKSRLLKITETHLEYIYDCLQRSTTKISNIQNYLITALYNSLLSGNLYYSQLVKHDLQTT